MCSLPLRTVESTIGYPTSWPPPSRPQTPSADFTLDSSLQAGSIPSTVEVLQLTCGLADSLYIRQLLSSLVHLVLLGGMNLPLAANVLPPSLQRLYMYSHPLAVGGLPSSLQALQMIEFNEPIEPHVLPYGLTHLSLLGFNQPLAADSLPLSLVYRDVGVNYGQPLSPHVLPSTLRVLAAIPCSLASCLRRCAC